MDVLFWAIAFILFVCAEVMTVQLVSIWFAFGAVTALASAILFEDVSFLMQMFIFVLASAVSLIITFPWLKKRREKKDYVSTNSELDVGKSAEVIEEINVDRGTGRVTLSGVNWSAVPEDGQLTIPVGTIVTVVKVQGAKLTVKTKTNQ